MLCWLILIVKLAGCRLTKETGLWACGIPGEGEGISRLNRLRWEALSYMWTTSWAGVRAWKDKGAERQPLSSLCLLTVDSKWAAASSFCCFPPWWTVLSRWSENKWTLPLEFFFCHVSCHSNRKRNIIHNLIIIDWIRDTVVNCVPPCLWLHGFLLLKASLCLLFLRCS